MVTPLTSEAEWRPVLEALPLWQPAAALLCAPTFILSPHPDDETLGAGGFIAHLRALHTPVTVLAVTDGEAAYLPVENNTPDPTLAPRRADEQAAALECLGVPTSSIVRLHLPDSALQTCESALLQALRQTVQPGSHLLAPWPQDFHPDHEACGRAALALARERDLSLTFYVFWTWHRGTPARLRTAPFVRFPLTPQEQRVRFAALQCHGSQLSHASGQPILPGDLLDPMHRPFEVFLPHELASASSAP